jgi:hypothetical protein
MSALPVDHVVQLRAALTVRLARELAEFEQTTGCIVARVELVHDEPLGAPQRLLGVLLDVALPRSLPRQTPAQPS